MLRLLKNLKNLWELCTQTYTDNQEQSAKRNSKQKCQEDAGVEIDLKLQNLNDIFCLLDRSLVGHISRQQKSGTIIKNGYFHWKYAGNFAVLRP